MIFEIDKRDLAKLSAERLRELVARLCMAERESVGGHRNEVRWGGHSNAPDGGIDVYVEILGQFQNTPTIPCRITVFQSKHEVFPRSEILREMRPNGALREAIHALAKSGGAYIIVSGVDDCSHSMLAHRKKAMLEAIASDVDPSGLYLDFFGQQEIADWVSKHPSVALWLRKRLNLPSLRGWQGYDCWSGVPAGQSDALIEGQGLKMTGPDGRVYSGVVDVIQCLRVAIRNAEKSIRVVGLSGIGKTRLVQEIFASGGVDAIPESWAIYTDEGHDPDPQPPAMLQWLIGLQQPAVLVVDNCGRELHNKLSQLWIQKKPAVRLVTIEYDVKLDEPAETDVYQLEVVDTDIAEVLIRRRFPQFSEFDAKKLAVISEGNARLALALAGAAPRHQSLSCFFEVELFNRLFWQRNQPNPNLEEGARILSLVYSFDMEAADDTELAFLAGLTNLDAGTLRASVVDLQERQLIQARGRWRAVLPHALANRLACQQLARSRAQELAVAFFSCRSLVRLRRSFARRLGFLHDDQNAIAIAKCWVEHGGLLDFNSRSIDCVDLDVFNSVSNLVPERSLELLQVFVKSSAFSVRSALVDWVISQLGRLAFFAPLFGAACDVLVDLAVRLENIGVEDGQAKRARAVLCGLFQLWRSGTTASLDCRLDFAKRLLRSNNRAESSIGVWLIESALKCSYWVSPVGSFRDARPSSFRLESSTNGEVDWDVESLQWYRKWIEVAVEASRSRGSIGKSVRIVLAENIFLLWIKYGDLRDWIESAVGQINDGLLWVEGYNALQRLLSKRTSRRLPVHRVQAAELDRLLVLRSQLAPVCLSDRVRSVLASGGYLDPWDEKASEHSDRLSELGKELSVHPEVFSETAGEIWSARHNNLMELGRAIAVNAGDPWVFWEYLYASRTVIQGESPGSSFMTGFVHALDDSSRELADRIRKNCLEDFLLRRIFLDLTPRGDLSDDFLRGMQGAISDSNTPANLVCRTLTLHESQLKIGQWVALLRTALSRRELLGVVLGAICRSSFPLESELVELTIDAIALDLTEASGHSRASESLDADFLDKLILCLSLDQAHRLIDVLECYRAENLGSLAGAEMIAHRLAVLKPREFLDIMIEPLTVDCVRRLNRNCSPIVSMSVIVLLDWCSGTAGERWVKASNFLRVKMAGEMTDGALSRHSESGHPNERADSSICSFVQFSPEPRSLLQEIDNALAEGRMSFSISDFLHELEIILRMMPSLDFAAMEFVRSLIIKNRERIEGKERQESVDYWMARRGFEWY